jgi:hypothetical protein
MKAHAPTMARLSSSYCGLNRAETLLHMGPGLDMTTTAKASSTVLYWAAHCVWLRTSVVHTTRVKWCGKYVYANWNLKGWMRVVSTLGREKSDVRKAREIALKYNYR